MKMRVAERPALELIDEAFALLRAAPVNALLYYYTGALPFVLGLLYFWADMSHGAFAHTHVAEASFGMALLFCWMKFWQSLFSRELLRQVSGEEPTPLGMGGLFRLLLVQGALQPAGILLRPIALLITLPYGWVRAWFETITLVGNGTESDPLTVLKESWTPARLWPQQNHVGLAWLTLFAGVVWINVASAIALAPWLLKTFLGIETTFTRSPWSMLNSTLLVATCAGTYLCTNPVLKAFYILRAFHAQSLRSGADLRVALRRVVPLILAGLIFLLPAQARASENTVRPATQTVEAARLEAALQQVLQRSEFAWRMPREQLPKDSFVGGLFSTFKKWVKWSLRSLRKLIEKLRAWLIPENREKPEPESASWRENLRPALYALLALALLAIGFFVWRRWRKQPPEFVQQAQPLAAAPNLADEDLVASQLPEDAWLAMATEMANKGEWRLASRAFYLAALAQLGRRELITLARHKSNRDYQRELRRRARTHSGMLEAFDHCLLLFERSWYGSHRVSRENLDAMAAQLERLRA